MTLSGLVARDLVSKWQTAVGQAALPVRFTTPSWKVLLTTTEHSVSVGSGGAIEMPKPPRVAGFETFFPVIASHCETKRDVISWLRRLVARASTLDERLSASWLVADTPGGDDLIQARLRTWAAYLGPAGEGRNLDRLLQWEGLDVAVASKGVGPVRMCDGTPLPGWATTLNDALFEADSEDLVGVCSSDRPLPFQTLLLPFTNIFQSRVRIKFPSVDALISPQARTTLACDLLSLLVQRAGDALYAEFCRFRMDGLAPLEARLSPEADMLYRRFVDEMQNGGLIAFFEQYPVLARILAVLTDLAVDATIEFLRRLEADLPEISRHWGKTDSGPVVAVQPALGDRHRGGRHVMAVTFANGLQLVYKPRNMGIDSAFYGFLAWLEEHDAPVILQPLRILNRGTHGWVEFIQNDPCPDEAAVQQYYRRAGALICLVYVLQGTDCHVENLIAWGDQPALVDCETLLNPRPRARLARGSHSWAIAERLIGDSVLSSSLLPAPDSAEDGLPNAICGLCSYDWAAPASRVHWVHVNTDRMASDFTTVRSMVLSNLPHIDGVPARMGERVETILEGFGATYRFFLAQRQALLAADGPLVAFRGRFVRFLLRNTRVYGKVFGHAYRVECLQDGVDASLNLEMLTAALFAAEQRPASWSVLQVERRALFQGDIPFLGACTDDDALLLEDGSRIEGYFVRSGYDALLAKVRGLSEQDLVFQAGLIRNAISGRFAPQVQPTTLPGAENTRKGDSAMNFRDIIRRAWRDPEFKRTLLESPRSVIERELGVVLPADLQVHIHEQTPTDVHLILPSPPERAEEQE